MATTSFREGIRVISPEPGKPRAAFADRSWVDPRASGPLGPIRWNGWNAREIAVHAGASRGEDGMYVISPTYTGTTVPALTCKELADRFSNPVVAGRQGFFYVRMGSDGTFKFECAIAGMHKAGDAMAFGSGMGAISHLMLALVTAGDNIVLHRTMYGCTDDLTTVHLTDLGVETRILDLSDPTRLRHAIDSRTRLVFFETPDNPTLRCVNIAAVAREVGDRCPIAVDNTLASPFGQNPLDQGAHFVVYSATKSIGGHSNAIGGLIVGSGQFLRHMFSIRNDFGSILVPREAAAFLDGVKTLPIRYRTMEHNACIVARMLSTHPSVEKVYFPGFDAAYPLDGQMKGPGHMVSFVLKGGLKAAESFVQALKMITNAVSLGGVESLVCNPAGTTHKVVPAEVRIENGIEDGLIRMSVGIESARAITNDLRQALRKI